MQPTPGMPLSVPTYLQQSRFIWAAGEALFTKAVHAWAVEERGHPAEWVKAAEYWRRK